METQLGALADLLRPFLGRSHVPYSGQPAAAAALLSDGSWVPGVRVESASFGLSIPAITNAVTTACASGRLDIVAVLALGPSAPFADAWVAHLPNTTPDLKWVRAGAVTHGRAWIAQNETALPDPEAFLEPYMPTDEPVDVTAARRVADRAWVPESGFRVGCVLKLANGRSIPGVNVEHPDWTGILCAERNALGTLVTFGCGAPEEVIVSCPDDAAGTPCGACRQLIVELAPNSMVRMDRGDAPDETSTPEELLPGAFTGRALRH